MAVERLRGDPAPKANQEAETVWSVRSSLRVLLDQLALLTGDSDVSAESTRVLPFQRNASR